MTSTDEWTYSRPRLAQALADWKTRERPDPAMIAAVDEGLMDLIRDPPTWGRVDPEHPGVFQGTITMATGVRILILYAIPDEGATRRVGVADIRTETWRPA